MIKFEEYLLERGLYEHTKDVGNEILENDELLHELADVWRGHRKAIELLLQARMQPIREELVMRALPVEVPVLRQNMLEVAAIADDLERYATEHERRTKAKEEENQQQADEGENPSSTD
jgi:hypothetical protein